MAHIPNEDDKLYRENMSAAANDSRDAFIGCAVPRYIKDQLIRMAMDAPGGARNVSWAINQILSERFANKQEQE